MDKYIKIASNTLSEYLTYRANFIFWRLQVFISFVVFYSLWAAVGQNRSTIANYSIASIYAYFIIGYILRSVVFSTRTQDIGGDIQSGNLSTLLLRPFSILKYYFARDIIDKLFNLFFLFFEFWIILFIYRPSLIFPNFSNISFFILFTILAIILFFFYSLVISFITFWSDNAWSSRFLFGVVFVTLFSGQYIPLDMLSPKIYQIISYTPFPYMYFFPLKVWLGDYDQQSILILLVGFVSQILFFYFLANLLWRRGIAKYQSYGN